jgi:hypothetical protein
MGNGEGAVVPKVARILIADDHALVREGLIPFRAIDVTMPPPPPPTKGIR